MSSVLSISLISFFLTIMGFTQSKPYWDNAPTTGTKIFSIEFIDTDNGSAKSKLGEVLKTTDGGKHWIVDSEPYEFTGIYPHLWSADIYCSSMTTKDGGLTWSQYTGIMQEHFCQVYFKNENTGWKTSEEFLYRVVYTLKSFVEKNDIEALYAKAYQCTEYYTDINSGWALGWCVKNYKYN